MIEIFGWGFPNRYSNQIMPVPSVLNPFASLSFFLSSFIPRGKSPSHPENTPPGASAFIANRFTLLSPAADTVRRTAERRSQTLREHRPRMRRRDDPIVP